MASAAAKQILRAATGSGEFHPVYYFHGDDDFLKEEALRQLIDAAVDSSTRDFNLESRRAQDLDAGVLGSLLGTPPMMAERRAVVIRDVTGLRKDARKTLDRYLDNPASDMLLALVSPGGTKADKALQARATSMQYDPLRGDHLAKWIPHHAQRLGVTITPAAAGLLQSAVGSELPALAIELEKLASFAADGRIGEAEVEAVVGIRRDETTGALLDAVAHRDAARALSLVAGVLQQPKTSAVQIVIAMTTQMLAIGWAQERRARRVPPAALSRELFEFLKGAGGAFTGRPWGEAVSCWVSAVGKWSPAEVDAALEHLLTADRSLKGSRISSDEQYLRNLVLALCDTRTSAARGAA
jgi:DNA polymerase III subunit delta